MREKTSERFMHGNAAPAPVGERFPPPGFFGDKFQYAFVSRMVGQQRATKLERIFARRVREFVNERLDHECVVRMPDRAQPQTRHAAGRPLPIHEQIRNLVRDVLRALNCRSSTPSFITKASNDVPAMNDWQTIRCCHATGLPSASSPALIE
jgi:hypothetical protein